MCSQTAPFTPSRARVPHWCFLVLGGAQMLELSRLLKSLRKPGFRAQRQASHNLLLVNFPTRCFSVSSGNILLETNPYLQTLDIFGLLGLFIAMKTNKTRKYIIRMHMRCSDQSGICIICRQHLPLPTTAATGPGLNLSPAPTGVASKTEEVNNCLGSVLITKPCCDQSKQKFSQLHTWRKCL